jgi:hypothetical protein
MYARPVRAQPESWNDERKIPPRLEQSQRMAHEGRPCSLAVVSLRHVSQCGHLLPSGHHIRRVAHHGIVCAFTVEREEVPVVECCSSLHQRREVEYSVWIQLGESNLLPGVLGRDAPVVHKPAVHAAGETPLSSASIQPFASGGVRGGR